MCHYLIEFKEEMGVNSTLVKQWILNKRGEILNNDFGLNYTSGFYRK